MSWRKKAVSGGLTDTSVNLTTKLSNLGIKSYDSFNRVDNASSLGSTDTGQTWVVSSGVMGINLNQGYSTSNNLLAMGTVDPAISDVKVTIDFVYRTGEVIGICFRTDGTISNRMGLTLSGATGALELKKTIAGTATFLGSTATTFVDGQTYSLKIEAKGDNVIGYLDGVQKFNVTDVNTLKTNTKHGAVLYSPVATNSRFDNMTLEANP